jgi:hypothetical protein
MRCVIPSDRLTPLTAGVMEWLFKETRRHHRGRNLNMKLWNAVTRNVVLYEGFQAVSANAIFAFLLMVSPDIELSWSIHAVL